jgi:Nif-specific regulatory protein
VGGNEPITVDVRVVSATNKKLEEEVAAGRFREDLYYRLNVVQIIMPSLRERQADIPLLTNYFLDIFKQEAGITSLTISKEAMEKMILYNWPGNVRELRNVLERAVVMGDGNQILPADLPFSIPQTASRAMKVGASLENAINEFKKEYIAQTLKHTDGNRTKAAEILNIQRTYLSRLISRYKLKDI